jgi:ABC-type multidrug transport system fused ATPase/permease subunit
MKTKSDGNPVWYLYKKMWQYSEGNKKNVILYVFLFIIVGILDVLIEPMIWSHILNRIQKGEITQTNVYEIVGLLGIILVDVIFFWALHGPARVIECNNAFKIRVNYREFLTKGTLDLPLLWHKTHHSGKTVDQMSKGTQALFSFSENSFEIIYSILELIIGCSVLAYYFPWSLVLTLGMLAASVWIISCFDKTLNTNNKILTRKENDISQIVIDVSGNMTTVITLRIAKLVFRSIMDKTREPFALFSSNNKVNEVKWFYYLLTLQHYDHRGSSGIYFK